MEKFEQMDALLDGVILDRTNWLNRLQAIREEADAAYNRGELTDYQWRVLVTRSAKIQDQINGD